MSNKIRVGDRVKYRAGRGYSEGRVLNIAEGYATIETRKDKQVNRLLKMCELVGPFAEPAEGATAGVSGVHVGETDMEALAEGAY